MAGSNVLNTNNYPHLKGKPHWKRTIAVYTALDNAPIHYSYSQLMEWVKQQTGKGCSRKLISKWKSWNRSQQSKVRSQETFTANSQQLFLHNIQSSEKFHITQNFPIINEPINNQESSSIISKNFPVNESINNQEDLPIYPNQPELPITHPTLHSCLLGLKRVGKITALTVMFLGANFIFTPQDVTVKLAIAEPQDNSLTTKLTTNLTPQPKPKTGSPNRIKINLTITDPSDLKVKPGDKVTKGQIISVRQGRAFGDRTTERQRLLNQKKQLELSLKKLTIAIPQIQPPQPISKLPDLPPISYQQERANIAFKEQQLKEAVQAVSNQQAKIESLKQLTVTSNQLSVNNQNYSNHQQLVSTQKVKVQDKNIATDFNYVDLKGNSVNSNQKTLTINIPDKNQSPNSNPTITIKPTQETQRPNNTTQPTITIKPTVTSNTKPSTSNSKLAVILEHETAIINQLKGNEEKAKRELQIAKSQLETAKEQRRYAEHQHYLENNRRAIALQQQQLELERQRTIRAGQLQEQEYSKTQIEAKIIEIDNAINQLSTVKIPYNGTIKKVKWTGQTDHTLTVTVTLDVDDSSERSNDTDE